MRHLAYLAMIVLVCSCDDPESDPVSPYAAIEGTWEVDGYVTSDGTPREEWSQFEISFDLADDIFGSYSTTGIPSEAINDMTWLDQGNWAIENIEGYRASSQLSSTVLFDDWLECEIILSKDRLVMDLLTPFRNGRAEYKGSWRFELSKKLND